MVFSILLAIGLGAAPLGGPLDGEAMALSPREVAVVNRGRGDVAIFDLKTLKVTGAAATGRPMNDMGCV